MTNMKKLIYRLKTEGALTDNITIEMSELELLDEAADALEQLQAELERVTAERDTAVEDLRAMCVGGDTCAFCRQTRADCARLGAGRKTVEPCWGWRGIQEEG